MSLRSSLRELDEQDVLNVGEKVSPRFEVSSIIESARAELSQKTNVYSPGRQGQRGINVCQSRQRQSLKRNEHDYSSLICV